MRLEIRNVRGISEETIEIPPGAVTPVRRLNAAGKTTIAACVSACLARAPDPLGLAPRTGLYVARATASDECFARLSDEHRAWSIRWAPASGEYVTSGDAPLVPEAALRFGVPLMGGSKREASRRWLDALLPDPVKREELEAELLSVDIQPVTATRLAAQAIPKNEDGTDHYDPTHFAAAWAVADTQCREAKGKWADIASAAGGERRSYGSSIAPKWRPKGWTNDLEGRGLSEIEQRLHDAKEAERLLSDECARLEEQVRAADRAQAATVERQSHIASLRRELAEAQSLQGGAPEGHADLVRRRDEAAGHASAADHTLRAARRTLANLQDESDRRISQDRYREQRLGELRARAEQIQRDHAHYQEQVVAGLSQSIERTEQDLRSLDEEMVTVGEREAAIETADETCTMCGQDLPQDEASAVKQRRLDIVRKDRDDLQRRRGDLQEGLGEARDKLDRVRSDPAPPPGLADANAEIDRLTEAGEWSSMADEIAEARNAVTAAERAWSDADRERGEAARRADESERAVGRKHEVDAKVNRLRGRVQEAEAVSDVDVPELPTQSERDEANRRRLRALDVIREEQTALGVRKAFDEATAAQDEVVSWDRVRTILSPDKGIQARRLQQRAEEMLSAIQMVNETIQKSGSWLPVVDINVQDRRLMVNDLPIEAGSNAERWWAQTVCRLGLAAATGSPIAIVDGADVIAPSMRGGYREAMATLADEKGLAILWTETA